MPRAAGQIDVKEFRGYPLCLLVVSVCAGIWLDAMVLAVAWWFWLAWSLVALAGWLVARAGNWSLAGAWLVLAVGLCVGGLHHRIWWDAYPANSVAAFLASDPQPASISGRVAQEPWWNFPRADPFDATPDGITSTLVLDAHSVATGSGEHRVGGQIRVFVAGQLSGLRYGDRVRVWGQLLKTRTPGNPGEIDFGWYGRARRQPGLLAVDHPHCVQLLERCARPRWLDGIASLRRRFDDAIWQYIPREPGLASAVLLGLRGYVDDDDRDLFLTTGTIHLLAISGLHVGILAASFVVIGRLLGVRRNWLLVATVGFVVGYAALVDFQPPVVRAAILISVWCLSQWWLRTPSPYNSLALSGLIVLALDPTALFQIGAQLSFLAMFAISIAQPWCVAAGEPDPIRQLIAESRSRPIQWLRALGAELRSLVIYSFFITLLTTPLVAYRFHLVSPIGLLINPLLMVPIAIALKAGLATLAFAPWFPAAAMFCGWICDGSLVAIHSLVSLAAEVPGGHWWTCGPAATGTLLFYVGAYLLLLYRPWGITPRAGAAAACSLLCLAWCVPDHWRIASPTRPLVLTFADVGHGGATLLQTPQGGTLLFDAGSMNPPYVTAQRIAGLLWYQRAPRIDVLVISHDDLDHYSAVARLSERFSIGRVLVAAETLREPSVPLAELLRRLERRRIPLQIVAAGDTVELDPTVDVRVLHPPAGTRFHSDNAESLVLAVSSGEHRLLLTADVEGPGLDQLLARPDGEWDVAMIPHHGSRFSRPSDFATWSGASELVVCNDEFSKDLLESTDLRAAADAPRVWVTGIDGAVRVELAPSGVSVRSWRHEPWKRY